ncbi:MULTISPECIES: DnaA N-terminal domain-containing protein [Rhodobacterales]|uniref:DnaA N-terminal domain-containing protein n=1 Tax=Roseobacter sp. N2S TaxID=2663844 RepID=UPI00285B4CE1|nr:MULTISPECIES: DnaA N-terminal domain-containing protein [Rhodobacterales]MDR6265716.1 hypothetical protein [Roseobacter sp. N2S]
MEPKRLTGPEAGSLKYDILTALTLLGLHGTATEQTSMMRLIALITARYNWRANELTVGQRDIARMWAVNERTVKREMKRLTDAQILVCKRSGVRGRVGAYTLNLSIVAKLSEPSWKAVGPDFEERMAMNAPVKTANVVKVDFAATPASKPEDVVPDKPGTWRAVQRNLRANDEAVFQNWYARLSLTKQTGGVVELLAPSRFVANYIKTHLFDELHRALEQEFGIIEEIRITT